ncbi:MAG: redox-sensing transcriptional repressor Rex [Acidimicrobiales bacterium]
MGTRPIPEATVARFPLYLRVLAAEHELTISSERLADRAGVNAAQVRKDLSHLGPCGTPGVGYDVAYLLRQINQALGLTERRRVAIVGAGNLGRALAGYRGFSDWGFEIVAALDVDPSKVGQSLGPATIYPMSDLAAVMSRQRVDIAMVTTPASAAQAAIDALAAAGVTAILNFAPVVVSAPPGTAIRPVDLGVELQVLSYHAAAGEGPRGRGGDWRKVPRRGKLEGTEAV